jgi:carbamoyltransferase
VSTRILGISGYYHDSAAALLVDGEIVSASQEERFTRKKGDAAFPDHAVKACLVDGGITIADVDHVIFYEKPLVKFERLLENYATFAPRGFRSFCTAVTRWSALRLDIAAEINGMLGKQFTGTISFADHHESHAASAFFPSPFDEAAILTLDGVGEWSTSSVGIGTGNRIELSEELRYPHSLGMLYSAFTSYTGFKVNSGEYKLMGLAPYGEPRFVDLILDKLVRIHDDGSVWLDLDYFDFCVGEAMTSDKFHQLFGGAPRGEDELITQKEMDLAASVQAVCETAVLRCVQHAHSLTGAKNLVMAGGVALNCVANGRVVREGPFEHLWVQPAAGDSGAAIGAALLMWHHVLDAPRHPALPDAQNGSMLGPAYRDDDVKVYLDSVAAVATRFDDEADLLDHVAALLEQGRVIGWFQGRMEFGPRALGARSIIGDPRSPQMQQTLNLKVKFRESFRPFAPSVLRDHAHDIFEMAPNEDGAYMLTVAPVREKWRCDLTDEDLARLRDPDLRVRVAVSRSEFPAVTHVDYSARVQTVDERHGIYHRLLQTFYERTGCPLVVNTSFNVRGEPIVNTPEEAYSCFTATDIDCLVIGHHVLVKEDQEPGSLLESERYRARFALD